MFPDGEFLTLGLLECIDRNPELAVTDRDGLPEFLSGCSTNSCSGQRQRPTARGVRPLALATYVPFSSLFSSAVEVGPCPLQLRHSLGGCLLPPKENLASPGAPNPQGHDTAVLILEVTSWSPGPWLSDPHLSGCPICFLFYIGTQELSKSDWSLLPTQMGTFKSKSSDTS